MTTITLLLAISANVLGVAALLMTISSHKNVHQIEEGLKECAARNTRTNIELETLINVVNKPKRKPGRPRKSKAIVHELGN